MRTGIVLGIIIVIAVIVVVGAAFSLGYLGRSPTIKPADIFVYRQQLLRLQGDYLNKAARASAKGDDGEANLWQESANNIAEELERLGVDH